MSKYFDDDAADTPEGVFIYQEDFEEMEIDAEMDKHAALILVDFIAGLREDKCVCPICIVQYWADQHGGIQ